MEQLKEASSASGASPAGPPPMFSDSQMRKLRFAVVGMGVILLLGFGLVIGRIVYLLNRTPAATDANTTISQMKSAGPPTSAPSHAKLALPDGAVIRNLSLATSQLAVHFDSPAGNGIAIIDLATGRTVQRFDITAAPRQ